MFEVDKMTALDCLNAMRDLGRPERADSWALSLRETNSWEEHAQMVADLRRDLDDVQDYLTGARIVTLNPGRGV